MKPSGVARRAYEFVHESVHLFLGYQHGGRLEGYKLWKATEESEPRWLDWITSGSEIVMGC